MRSYMSVGFSAAPPFIIAATWFIVFGLYLVFIFIRHCCCGCCRSREPFGCSRTAYAFSLGFLILFTTATIVGCVFTYVGQQKFENNVVKVTSFVLHQADYAFGNLRNLLDNLLAAKNIGVEQLTLPPEMQGEIDQIGQTVNTLADNFHSVSANSTNDIRNFLKPIRLSLIYIAAALLLVSLLGFVISIIGLKCLVYCLVIIGWILVTATLIISGMFLLVHNAVEDTCVAVDEWLQNPTADSALENIIPKVDNETSQKIFSVSKGVTYGVIQVIDGAIANVSNANNIPPNAGPIYYNQSGPLMPLLCNPYNSDFTERQCAPGEVDFNNASQVWSMYTCQVSESGICTTPGRLTPKGYADITASLNVSYSLYEESPFLVDLIDSTYIKETFDTIRKSYCGGLSKYSKWTYAGFITASGGVILSLMLWIGNTKGSSRGCACCCF